MFSQLCRARPRNNKWAVLSQRAPLEAESNGCRLQYCTFCDYRVCCQVIPESSVDWESESGQVTDNPAYGLSSDHWFFEEEEEEENVSGMEDPRSHTSQTSKPAEEGVTMLKPRPLDLQQKRPFPLSLMRPVARPQPPNPVSRQRPVQRNARDRFQNADAPKRQADPLSDMAPIRTEESIQEWLARIGESSAWQEEESTQQKEVGPDATEEEPPSRLLRGASKASPANVPMVVMQCSRLHSHLGCRPPFQQTSLPMGTLVTALYQEADWLYVQTPHGVEGFVASANCAPIGAANEPPGHASRRPWEPCDFPIRVVGRRQEFGSSRQQGGASFVPTRLPEGGAAYVGTVRMKTSFYGDRYLSHTFKSKDSIKTAKTVTDILRSSPETKVSNQ